MVGTDRRRGRREEGFTLIELMVVVLIIAILIAVAIPTFMGSRDRAQNRAAQSLARLGLSAQFVHLGTFQAFSDDNAPGGALDSIEPDINWGTLDASLKGAIATLPGGDDQSVILRSQSRTGIIYCLGRLERGTDAGTYFTMGCDGTEAAATVATWSPSLAAGWAT